MKNTHISGRWLLRAPVVLLTVFVSVTLLADEAPPPAISEITVAYLPNHGPQLTIKGKGFSIAKPSVFVDGFPVNVIAYTVTTVLGEIPASANLLPGDYLLTLVNSGTKNETQETSTARFTVTLGAVGPQGAPGPIGPTGQRGDTGTTGPPGLTGVSGPTGPRGVPGVNGIPGAAGLPGSQGPIGPVGQAGLNWKGPWIVSVLYTPNDAVSFAGSTYVNVTANNTGRQPDVSAAWQLLAQHGDTGVTGLAGLGGAQGPPGIAGTTGLAGPQGLKGDPGVPGSTGSQGPSGAQGPLGVAGPAGAGGPQGLKGDPGAPGSTGAQGPKGDTGTAGPQGVPGISGTNGINGMPGVIGPSGSQGPAGPVGPAGDGLNWKGPWIVSAIYAPNDTVGFGGSTYVNVAANNTGQPPDMSAAWQLVAQHGDVGVTGLQGPAGSQGPVGVTGPTGLGGPQGPKGDPGAAGPAGIAGTAGMTGPAGPNAPLWLSAHLGGSLNVPWTAAQVVPPQDIAIQRVSVNLKTAGSCGPAVVRIANGSTGQDIFLPTGQTVYDSGPEMVPFTAATPVQIKLQQGANCSDRQYPSDAEVMIQYTATQGNVSTTCASGNSQCAGICTSTAFDSANCGACGTACTALTHATPACANGACGIGTCLAGFGDCNHNASDGCETSLGTDLNNCGACGTACTALAHATSACANGACGIGTCLAGFGDCNHNASDGCETSLSTDLNNCGTCGTACPQNQTCSGGVCH